MCVAVKLVAAPPVSIIVCWTADEVAAIVFAARHLIEQWAYFAKSPCIPSAHSKGNSDTDFKTTTTSCLHRTKRPEEDNLRRRWEDEAAAEVEGGKKTLFRLETTEMQPQVRKQFYQYQCLSRGAGPQPSTRGSTRPLGPRWSGSHLHPHTPPPHKTPCPCHTHRLDTAPGTISDRCCRLSRPLCRNLDERQAADIITHT